MCYQITTMTLARNVNAVRFTSDGSRVSLYSDMSCVIDSINFGIGAEKQLTHSFLGELDSNSCLLTPKCLSILFSDFGCHYCEAVSGC